MIDNLQSYRKQQMVSVLMITHNHEKYIEEAIKGILMQQVVFPVELLICNDASTDNTNKIIESSIHNNKSQVIITHTDHKQNIGMMSNFIFGLKNCKSKYIALCDGDDYWTDPLKLQKQVDFLEGNNDFSICCTNAYHVKKETDFKVIKTNTLFAREKPCHTIEQVDLLYQNCILTATVVLRNSNSVFPEWMKKVALGDWCLFILYSFCGKIMYLSDVTAVYRFHEGGIFSMLGIKKQLIPYINTGELIRENIPEASFKMRAGQQFRVNQLLDIYKKEEEFSLFLKYYLKYQYLLTSVNKKQQLYSISKIIIRHVILKSKNVVRTGLAKLKI